MTTNNAALLLIALKAQDDASKALRAAVKPIVDVKKQAAAADAPLARMGGTMNTVLKAGAIAATGALIGLVGAGVKALMSASDVAESQNKVNVVFGESAAAINEFASTSAKSLGISRGAALDASGTFGNMFTQLGIAPQATADMSQGMIRLAADLGSFHNADITEVIAAQTAAFRGEFDSVQRFVPTINAAAVAEAAMAMTGKTATAMLTEQDKALATNKLLMEGAGKALGDFGNTSTGTANSMKIIKASLEDAAVTLGEKLLPIVEPLISAFAANLPGAIDAALSAFDRVGSIVMPVIAYFRSVVDAIQDIGVDGNTFASIMTGIFEDVLSKVQNFISQLVSWVQARLPDWIGTLQQWAKELIAWIAPMIPPLIGELLQMLGRMLDWIGANAPGIAERFLSEWLPAAIKWVAEAAIAIMPELAKLAVTIAIWVVTEGVPKVTGAFAALGVAIIRGIIQGIWSLAGSLFSALGDLAGQALQAAKDRLGIASPSKVFMEIGQQIVQGLAQGIITSKDAVRQALMGIMDIADLNADIDAMVRSGNLGSALERLMFSGASAEQAIAQVRQVHQVIRDEIAATAKAAADAAEKTAADAEKAAAATLKAQVDYYQKFVKPYADEARATNMQIAMSQWNQKLAANAAMFTRDAIDPLAPFDRARALQQQASLMRTETRGGRSGPRGSGVNQGQLNYLGGVASVLGINGTVRPNNEGVYTKRIAEELRTANETQLVMIELLQAIKDGALTVNDVSRKISSIQQKRSRMIADFGGGGKG